MQHLSGRWMKALNGIVIALSLALPGAAWRGAGAISGVAGQRPGRQGKPTCRLQSGGRSGRNRG